eukprot:TRINITY_DN619_c4_g1_i1.p2 TRINITY_DN619_c4_g1~~TRINITY_DN619_c4_g1_i1.p2  ORF type:complete len:268 (+),score=74.43 TRINITY_DN619_c4_g1_i1:45-806(+)
MAVERPAKTLSKQRAGIAAVTGMLGVVMFLAGLVMAIIGASWDDRSSWAAVRSDNNTGDVLNVSTVNAKSQCSYKCDCTRECADPLESPATCYAKETCQACEGTVYEYHVTPAGHCRGWSFPLSMVRGCEGAARWQVGSVVPVGFIRGDCGEWKLPEDFELGHPTTYRRQAESTYVWKRGVFVLSAGVVVIAAAVGLWVWARPSFVRSDAEGWDYNNSEWTELMRFNLGDDAVIPPMPSWFARNPYCETDKAK